MFEKPVFVYRKTITFVSFVFEAWKWPFSTFSSIALLHSGSNVLRRRIFLTVNRFWPFAWTFLSVALPFLSLQIKKALKRSKTVIKTVRKGKRLWTLGALERSCYTWSTVRNNSITFTVHSWKTAFKTFFFKILVC